MSDDYLKKLKEIFNNAVDLPYLEQLEFLKNECGNDHKLFDDLCLMLQVANNTGQTIDSQEFQRDSSKDDNTRMISNDIQDDQTSPPDKQINHYKIIKQIGYGGMGTVYEAFDSKLERKVAIKFLTKTQNDDAVNRFLREARSAASLNHPNIVTIYEIGEYEHQAYIAMELLEGKALNEYIQDVQYSIEDAVKIIVQVCNGLAAAHEKKIIHRDIKPHNIFLTTSNTIRILDFGLAKLIDDNNLTQAGMRLGTVNYMSPEQGQGLSVDHRSDIFSTGIILYELITKLNPFAKKSIPATIYSIVHDEPLPLIHYNSKIPNNLQEIVSKAIYKSVSERYQNITELMLDLKKIYNDSQFSKISSPGSTAIDNVKTLAILYLRNIGNEKDEFISYGITEDLIINMSRISDVRTIPMRTIVQYKDSTAEINTLAQQIKTDIILDGSINRLEDKISVSVQMLDVATGNYLWAERWQEDIDNLPQIKTELMNGICKSLNISISTDVSNQLETTSSKNADAYEKLLKGRYLVEHRKNKADIELANSLFNEAIILEPKLFSAQIGLVEILLIQTKYKAVASELNKIYKQDLNNLDRIKALLLFVDLYYRTSKYELAIEKANTAIELAQECNDIQSEAACHGKLISIYQKTADYDHIFNHFEKVLEINHKLKDSEKIGEALKNMGITYARMGNYEQALNLYYEALSFAEKQENFTLQAACYSNIGNIHFFNNDLSSARVKYQDALEISEKIGDKAISARQKLNLALVFVRNSQYDDGVSMLQNAAEDFKVLGDNSNYAIALTNLSQVNLHLNKIEQSIDSANQALKIAEELNHPIPTINSLVQLGIAHFYMNEYRLAENHLTDALNTAEKNDLSRYVAQIKLLLARTYLKLKNYDSANSFAKSARNNAKELQDNFISSYSSAVLGLSAILNGRINIGLKQVKDAVAAYNTESDSEQVIELNYLLGDTLISHSNNETDILNGKQILKDILIKTRETNFTLMEIRIKESLEKTDSV
ncbi:MAG: hypothetical protein DWP97_06490 [Calditrichaeota bacterium]|nr:MAG: hypothetical protein DWP97_06490 [Calditrichota bacterium]